MAVVVVRVVESDGDGVGLAESATTMRTGVVALVTLALAAAVAIVGAVQPRLDANDPAPADSVDDASWRWSADDA
ncbi:hypothetical protein [Ilumatobacter sp.]|uniref:hypothetical protein n=1 Tax=Ilumatobacter sp. TaxID=1967498 RepID=UPI003C695EA7